VFDDHNDDLINDNNILITETTPTKSLLMQNYNDFNHTFDKFLNSNDLNHNNLAYNIDNYN
jgi:hypothetical protein